MSIYWVDMNLVLAIYSVSVKKILNKFEVLVGYFGVLLAILSLKFYTVIPNKCPFVRISVRPYSCFRMTRSECQ